MKKLISLFLLLLLVSTVLAGCGSDEAAVSEEASDGTLTVLTNLHVKDAEEVEAMNAYVSEQLGFPVEFVIPGEGFTIDQAYESGTYYDVMYTSEPWTLSAEYAMPLDDIIAGSEILSDPAVIPTESYDAVKEFSGQEEIYGIPNKSEGELVLIYRKDWLEEFGMEEPTTLEEWEAYMKKANEEYGAYGFASSKLYDIQGFMSAAGVQYGFVQDENGMWTVPYASEEAIPVYQWLADLYAQGLYEPNLLTNGSGEMRELFMSDQVAVIGYWTTWVGIMNDIMAETNPEFEAMGAAPVVDENGNGYTRAGAPGTFMIHKDCGEDLDEAIAFLEFMHTPEGALMMTAGVPGHDYNVDENGDIVFTETGKEHAADHGAPIPLNTDWQETKPYDEYPLTNATESSEKQDPYAYLPNTTAGDWVAVEDIINNYGCQAIMGLMPVEEAVVAMQAEIQPILDEMNAQ